MSNALEFKVKMRWRLHLQEQAQTGRCDGRLRHCAGYIDIERAPHSNTSFTFPTQPLMLRGGRTTVTAAWCVLGVLLTEPEMALSQIETSEH